MIIHSSTPLSMLKAAMLSRLDGTPCYHKDMPAEFPAGTASGGIIDCDRLPWEKVRQMYERKAGPIRWLTGDVARRLSGAVHYASRYRAPDNCRLIVTVLGQALDNGADYVLSRVSREARQMMNRARQVSVEVHRACGFVRLIPVPHGSGEVMVGKIELTHYTADLVLRYFTRRHRQPIYLITGETAYFLADNSVKTARTEELPFVLPEDDFAALWEAYYDAQFIETRKNTALARKHLPKKYWSWVPEGEKLK